MDNLQFLVLTVIINAGSFLYNNDTKTDGVYCELSAFKSNNINNTWLWLNAV